MKAGLFEGGFVHCNFVDVWGCCSHQPMMMMMMMIIRIRDVYNQVWYIAAHEITHTSNETAITTLYTHNVQPTTPLANHTKPRFAFIHTSISCCSLARRAAHSCFIFFGCQCGGSLSSSACTYSLVFPAVRRE